MRIKEVAGDAEDPINMTPMIDMVFLLLIFFLVATTFATEERDVKVQLPRIAQSQPLSAVSQELVINIREDGQTSVAGQLMDEAALGKFLSEQTKRDPGRAVLIRADERSLHKYFAAVARICKHAGVHELKIGYVDSVGPMLVE